MTNLNANAFAYGVLSLLLVALGTLGALTAIALPMELGFTFVSVLGAVASLTVGILLYHLGHVVYDNKMLISEASANARLKHG